MRKILKNLVYEISIKLACISRALILYQAFKMYSKPTITH